MSCGTKAVGFQQNTYSVDDNNSSTTLEKKTTERSEAAADMFLNWVYRRTTGATIDANTECATTGPFSGDGISGSVTWEGFRNILPDANYDPVHDAIGLSGNSRFIVMQDIMTEISNEDPNWESLK